ncbi:MAG: DUF6264 family protein [Microbacteriaceae bacterium]
MPESDTGPERDGARPDSRPRPQYGELAPEGWKWVPPSDAPNPDGVHPGDNAPAVHKTHVSRASHPPQTLRQQRPGVGAAGRTPPPWDRLVTLLLLVLGVLGLVVGFGILAALPESIQLLYTQNNLGEYTPAASVSGIITIGQVCLALILVGAAAWSILRLRAKRVAFVIPLAAGVLAAVVLFGLLAIVLYQDTTLLNFYGAG